MHPHRVNRRHHRSARRQAIVDQNHHLILELHRRTRPPVNLLAPQQLPRFPCHHCIERSLINRVRPQRLLIENLDAAAGNRAHGEFFVRRHAELAHQHQVEANIQRRGHFVSHWYAASGQGENDHVRAIGVGLQRRHQTPPRRRPVLQNHVR
jgi:hypothetical protein